MEPSGGAVVGGAWWLEDSQNNVITDSAGNAFDAGTIIDDWQACRTGIGGTLAGGSTQIQAIASRSTQAAAVAGGFTNLQALAMQSSTGGTLAGGSTQIQAVASRSAQAAAVAGGFINLQAMALQNCTGGAVVGGTMGLPPKPTNLLRICYTVTVSRNQFLADNYRTTVRRRY